MKYGYSDNKNEILQDVDRMFTDEVSMNDRERVQLNTLLNKLQNGDTLVVKTLGRLGWGTRGVIRLVKILVDKDVRVVCQEENFDSYNSITRDLIKVFDSINSHRFTNIKNDKVGRKPIEIDESLWNKYYNLWKNKSIKKIRWRKEMGLSHTKFYCLFKERVGSQEQQC
jgi:hypothetical protein